VQTCTPCRFSGNRGPAHHAFVKSADSAKWPSLPPLGVSRWAKLPPRGLRARGGFQHSGEDCLSQNGLLPGRPSLGRNPERQSMFYEETLKCGTDSDRAATASLNLRIGCRCLYFVFRIPPTTLSLPSTGPVFRFVMSRPRIFATSGYTFTFSNGSSAIPG
jgi:hypothetical protein